MMYTYLVYLWRQIDGSARLAGDGLHLPPRPSHVRSEEVARAGKDAGEGIDRVPPRIERIEVHVRPRDGHPGAGDRIVGEGSKHRLQLRHAQLRLVSVRLRAVRFRGLRNRA